MSLFNDDKKYILNTYNRINIDIVKGEGSYLIDKNGNKYLDFFSGIAVNQFGHNHDELKNKIFEQINNYIHLSNYFPQESVVKLAKLLVENTFASKVFFSNTGTEANEAAIKICVKYGTNINKSKYKFLSAYNSFHGRTLGGLNLTGKYKYKKPFKNILSNTFENFEYNNIEDLKSKLSENTCAVFLEPIQGEGGIIELSQEFIDELVELRNKYGFLIILDEIQTGLGRTTDLFGYSKYNFTPDLVTIAKALGGGIPLGATLVSKKLELVLEPGDHGTTFGGNPVACSAGIFLLEQITNNNFINEMKKNASYLYSEILRLKEKHPNIIKEIRGRGFMLGLEVGSNNALCIKNRAMEKEKLLINVTSESVIRLLPRIDISKKEVDIFIEKFENSF